MQVYSRCERLEQGAQGATAAGDTAMDEDTDAPSAAEVQEQQVRLRVKPSQSSLHDPHCILQVQALLFGIAFSGCSDAALVPSAMDACCGPTH